MTNKKGKLLEPKKVRCASCQSEFVTNHSMGKYCSDPCRRIGWRKSWVKYGQRNRKRRLAYGRKHYLKNRERRSIQIKKYQKSAAGRRVQKITSENNRRKFPEKYQARQEVLKALRKGILVKQPCEVCGEVKVEAHHEDYSKPLEVNWLCEKHHKRRN